MVRGGVDEAMLCDDGMRRWNTKILNNVSDVRLELFVCLPLVAPSIISRELLEKGRRRRRMCSGLLQQHGANLSSCPSLLGRISQNLKCWWKLGRTGGYLK